MIPELPWSTFQHIYFWKQMNAQNLQAKPFNIQYLEIEDYRVIVY